MRGRTSIFILLLLFAPVLSVFAGPAGAAKQPQQPQALIIYDGQSQKSHEGLVDGTHIANLMGHFNYRPLLKAAEEYRPGSMADYAAVFIVGGSDKTVWPAAVLSDARARTTTLCWIGYGINSFLGNGEGKRRGVEVNSVLVNSRYNSVQYRGSKLGKGGGMVTLMNVKDPKQVVVEAEMSDPEGHKSPYIMRIGKLWLVADVPFAYIDNEDRYYAFCDILHDILGVNHPTSRNAMIRIEDVTPDDEPSELIRAVDIFIKEKIPFQVGVVPVFVDPGSRREVRLSESPKMIQALRYAEEHGGTLVVHGYTHQYHGVTPDDFEFWDGFRNAPRADDSPELAREKVNEAIEEFFRSGLYPVAWETPHYAASPTDYAEFGRVFSTLYEETMIDVQGSQQSFPFPTTDIRGHYIVPENIGYLPQEDPRPSVLIGNARAMLVVRDGMPSAFVHAFIDLRLIQETVKGIKNLGYKFISLRDFNCRVAVEDRLVTTGSAPRKVLLRDSYLREFILGPDGSVKKEVWAKKRQTGMVTTTLKPGPGEILVGIGMDELPPKPPGMFTRIGQKLVSAVTQRWKKDTIAAGPLPMKAAVVWNQEATRDESKNQASFANVFRAYGVPPRLVPVSTFKSTVLNPEEVLVVPHVSATALSEADVKRIVEFVRGGGDLILDGRSRLAEAVGVRYPGGSVTVGHVIDNAQVDLPLQWRPAVSMTRFRLPDRAVMLSKDMDNHSNLAGAFSVGSGKVIYHGVRFDPYTVDGMARYPFLFEHALKQFDRMQSARRPSIELYFDPGLRTEVSIEDLAVLWRRMGVRAIYAAAWVFTPRYTYDYERLIRVCHANGILVYAWFEFPQVSPLFWAQHPEWREKPGEGTKQTSWRLAMNLANPECRAAALEFMTSILKKWDFDGVNLAELNFDAKADGDKPWAMVPLNDDVRRDFRKLHRFDPMELFKPSSPHYWKQDTAGWQKFLDYRTKLVTDFHKVFLKELKPFMESGNEVIVTMLDSLLHPDIKPDTGIDSAAIVDLMDEYPFTLQVEDPAATWKNPPSRYVKLADHYRSILPKGARFMIDINVVPDRYVEDTHLPSSLAIGAELAATVRAARTASPRVAIYGDSTVRTTDLNLLSYAAAEEAHVKSNGLKWSVDTPYSIEMAVSSGIKTFFRSDRTWSLWRPGFVILPPGQHSVTAERSWLFHWFDTSELTPQLLQVSAPLLAAETARSGLNLEYNSPAPVYVCLSRKPAGVYVDSGEASILPGAREIAAVLVLPAGRHKATIASTKGAALVLDFASLISSSLIVAFGTLSILTLALLYVGIRIRRFFRK